MTTKNFTERIGDLVGIDELETAITELKNFLQKSKRVDEIIVQSARYNELMEQMRMGTINFEDANVTKNKIRYAILSIVRDIEENIEANPALETEADKTLEENKSVIIQNTSTIGNNSNQNIVVQGIQNIGGDFSIG